VLTISLAVLVHSTCSSPKTFISFSQTTMSCKKGVDYDISELWTNSLLIGE